MHILTHLHSFTLYVSRVGMPPRGFGRFAGRASLCTAAGEARSCQELFLQGQGADPPLRPLCGPLHLATCLEVLNALFSGSRLGF